MDVAQTSVMDKAETLLLRCVQPYVKEIARRRLHFVTAKIGEDPVDGVDGSPATNMVPATVRLAGACVNMWIARSFAGSLANGLQSFLARMFRKESQEF